MMMMMMMMAMFAGKRQEYYRLEELESKQARMKGDHDDK
jgi:hypothetical protein